MSCVIIQPKMRDCVCRPDKIHLYCDTITPLNRAHSELSPEYLDAFWLRAQPKNFNSYGATPNEFVAHNSVDDGPFRGHFCRPRRPRRLSLACRPSPYACARHPPTAGGRRRGCMGAWRPPEWVMIDVEGKSRSSAHRACSCRTS